MTRSASDSYDYNQNENTSTIISHKELVQMFVDVVSKSGNMLFNIGPKPDGQMEEHEEKLLLSFGDWMKKHGQAIYDSRPWSVLPLGTYTIPVFTISSENKSNNVRIRFLEKNGKLYIFFNPDLITDNNILTIPYVRIPETSDVQLCMGPDSWRKVLAFETKGYSVAIKLPAIDYHDPMHCLQIHPIPDWLIVPSLEK